MHMRAHTHTYTHTKAIKTSNIRTPSSFFVVTGLACQVNAARHRKSDHQVYLIHNLFSELQYFCNNLSRWSVFMGKKVGKSQLSNA